MNPVMRAAMSAVLACALLGACGQKSDGTSAPAADAVKPVGGTKLADASDKAVAAKADVAKADAAKPATPAAGGPPKGVPVNAEKVRVGKVDDELSAVGSLIAEDAVVIRNELDGRITALHFQEGQAVRAGALLVSLDGSEYAAQSAQVKADLKTEQQRLLRARDLSKQGFFSKDALEIQEGTVARLKAKQQEASSRLTKMSIYAPFAGVVGLRQVSPGAYVKAGSDIVRLENVSTLKVDFRMPETYLARLMPNQDIFVRLDAFPEETFQGKVYASEPSVDERTRTVVLRARIANPSLKLKPGMFVRVAVTVGSRPNAITVPEQAIWPQGRDSFVYRVVDGKAVLTKIEIGTRRPGLVEVAKGLTADDMVVTDGQIKLKDGAPVTVIPAAPPATAGSMPNKS